MFANNPGKTTTAVLSHVILARAKTSITVSMTLEIIVVLLAVQNSHICMCCMMWCVASRGGLDVDVRQQEFGVHGVDSILLC